MKHRCPSCDGKGKVAAPGYLSLFTCGRCGGTGFAKLVKFKGPDVAPYSGPKSSRPFEKWWNLANDRRQKLIVRKHESKDLSFSQERELEMLQKIADMVIEFLPFCCTHHEEGQVGERFCSCRCHLVGHRHKRDAKGRCTVCRQKLREQKERVNRMKRADKVLALVEREFRG